MDKHQIRFRFETDFELEINLIVFLEGDGVSLSVQIFVAEKFCNKMESNKLKKSYYKLFWSNQVGNQTKMAYYYPQIIQFFDANE